MPLWFEISVLVLLFWIGSSLYLIYVHIGGLGISFRSAMEILERLESAIRDRQR